MARVRHIEIADGKGNAHPTEVDARVKVFGDGANGPVVQVDTFGSTDRDLPGKLSQTIQFDRTSGLRLLEILEKAYR
jgi:hypothetical protein